LSDGKTSGQRSDTGRRRSPERREPFPEWLKKRVNAGGVDAPACVDGVPVRELVASLRLDTVCRAAHCPNQCECFGKGTATFMIMGSVCSRNCRFCAVDSGVPTPLEADEPERVAEACKRLALKHVVVTSVTRDDLSDGGAEHFARTIRAVRQACGVVIEVLTPDFQGSRDAIDRVADAKPDIFNHNIETIARLYPVVRPQADYRRSLELLRYVKERSPAIFTKSGMMVGVGETRDEVLAACADLRAAGCDILTVGQYLRPSRGHLAIDRFVTPEEFDDYRGGALSMGFLSVASGPFVRSSYNAREVFEAIAPGRMQIRR